MLREKPGVARDLQRIDAMWQEALDASGGPFLFGALQHRRRLLRAGLHARAHLRPAAGAAPPRPTCAHILALPAFLEWEREALAEHDFGFPRTSRTGRGLKPVALERQKQKRAEARFSCHLD